MNPLIVLMLCVSNCNLRARPPNINKLKMVTETTPKKITAAHRRETAQDPQERPGTHCKLMFWATGRWFCWYALVCCGWGFVAV